MRQPTYSVPDGDAYVATYKAILDQYDGLVSALVIDQTNNPGGSAFYAEKFVRLFAKQKTRGSVQRHNADRKWLQTYQAVAKEVDPTLQSEVARLFLHRAKLVEAAYDAGEPLTEPMGLFGSEYLEPHADYTWTKPVLLLANELAGSCGDIVPMLMQRNGLAKVFGERTMGLGGNVEDMPVLTNSRILMKMTRGLFTTYEPSGQYRAVDFVENNGIAPDLPFRPTVADARAGFVGYVKAFSDVAAAL